MQIAILADTHCGVRNSSDIFLENAEKFYQNVFFPECEKRGIEKVLHLGDIFDNRKSINVKALSSLKSSFLSPLGERGMKMDLILGNHDLYFRNILTPNSPSEILDKYKNIKIISNPQTLNYGGVRIALVPWITSENEGDVLGFIQRTSAKILAGHLELSGFEYTKGIVSSEGMSPSVFSKFDLVMSGHYHTTSSKMNIAYLGAPMEYFWSDAEDPRYFHIFDTESEKLTKIRNPYTLFKKINYKPNLEIDVEECDHKFVKILVRKCDDREHLNSLMDRILERPIHDLKLMDHFTEDENFLWDSDESVDNIKDTPHLLDDYIQGLETSLDKDKLREKMSRLYQDAQTAEFQ